MKKIIALFSAVTILSAGAAFAATAGTGTFGTAWSAPNEAGTITWSATGVGAQTVFTAKCSANVSIGLQGSDGTNYVVGSYHSSGSKTYASSAGDSRIWMQDKNKTNGTFATPPTIAASPDWTGWTAVK